MCKWERTERARKNPNTAALSYPSVRCDDVMFCPDYGLANYSLETARTRCAAGHDGWYEQMNEGKHTGKASESGSPEQGDVTKRGKWYFKAILCLFLSHKLKIKFLTNRFEKRR